MSLVPYIFRNLWQDPWTGLITPSRPFFQEFGNALPDNDLALFGLDGVFYRRPPQLSGMSEVINNNSEFCIHLDVSQFRPEELQVTTMGNRVIIRGRHEEREDEYGSIKREFKRQYILPRDVDLDRVSCSLSTDYMLTVRAPKMALEAPEEHAVPVVTLPDA